MLENTLQPIAEKGKDGSFTMDSQRPPKKALKKASEPMVDLPTAAEHFSVCVDFLRGKIRQGKIRHYRLGIKLLRVRLSEVEADLVKMRRRGRPRRDHRSVALPEHVT